MKQSAAFLIALLLLCSCNEQPKKEVQISSDAAPVEIGGESVPSLIVLGTVQDAGSPHIACKKECCKALFLNADPKRKVVSLGLIDPLAQKKYLFEATPDIGTQLRNLSIFSGMMDSDVPSGIFLTHAHIGHYTGLMHLGKEATNAQKVAVYAMPKMTAFLEQNGPWSQLVTNNNIKITSIENKEPLQITSKLSVLPFTVPHRDEYSETVGYQINGPNKTALFIPDINKWSVWDTSIVDAIAKVDYAFLDATFYDGEELNNRDISEIPHPFVIESTALFKTLPKTEKNKIFFIHFNHTNPLLNTNSTQYQDVITQGFRVAQLGDVFSL